MSQVKLLHKELCYVKEYHSNTFKKRLNRNTILNKMPQSVKLDSTEAIIILESGYTNLRSKPIIKLIKKLCIKKIYFFIEDVFRIESPGSNILDTFVLEDPYAEYSIPELDLINHIIKKTKCKHEMYHCEYNSKIIEEKYNIKLKYYDLFFCRWIKASLKSTGTNTFNDVFNKSFKYKLSCFNLRPDYHRTLIASLLYDLPNVILTLNSVMDKEEILLNKALPIYKFSPEISNKIITNTSEGYLDYNKLTIDTDPKDVIKDKVITISGTHQDKTLLYMDSAFVNVVTETRYATPTVYISEKTLKPMFAGRPFILLGPPGTLALLKKLGFKTFDKFWSEDYDNITDHNLRFEAVYHLANSIAAKSDEELEQTLSEMYDILEHNYNHLYSNFNDIFFSLND